MRFYKLLLVVLLFSIKFSYAQKEFISSGDIINKSMLLADSGEYKAALLSLDKVNRSDTNYVIALLKKAMVCQADSQYIQGIKYCKQAQLIKTNHNLDPDIYNTHGGILIDMEKYDEAIKLLDTAIYKYPSNSLLYFNKGLAYLRLNKLDQAEIWFQKTLLINPYVYTAHYNLAVTAVLQGKIVPGYIGYMSYLLFYPKGKNANNAINMLQQLSIVSDQALGYKNNRSLLPNDNFQAVEDVIFSKIALDESYKLQTELNDPISRQIQAVIEKIEYNENDPDFYIQYYVPFLKKVYANQKFNTYIHHIFSSVDLPQIKAYSEKNKKQIDAFIAEAGEYYDVLKATRELMANRRDTVSRRYYYENGNLLGRGFTTKNGKNLTGNWEGYYAGGQLKTKGFFNATGQRTGNWIWYNTKGTITANENYVNGKLNGLQEYFFENGNKSSSENYSNGDLQGTLTAYQYGGGKKSVSNYVAGKLEGEQKFYYINGELSAINHYKAGQLEGIKKDFNKNGKLRTVAQYINGKQDGAFKEYNSEGTIINEGNFVKGKSEGPWKYYYDDGKIKKSVQFHEDLENGLHQEYYPDGKLSLTLNVASDKINGDMVQYYRSGKTLSVRSYTNSVLTEASYLDDTGKPLSSFIKNGNEWKLTSYDNNGFKKSSSSYNKLGQLHGADTLFYSIGKVYQISNYADDVQDGKITIYYRNGKVKSETTMVSGETNGYYTSYYMNGKTQAEGWIIRDSNQGLWAYYDEDGKLNTTQYFLNNDIDGYKEDYYANGQKSREFKYHLGWLEGITHFDTQGNVIATDDLSKGKGKYRLLFPNGKLSAEANFVNGEINGTYKSYYFDGSTELISNYKYGDLDSTYLVFNHGNVKSYEAQYRNGERTGKWKFYDDKGKLSRMQSYHDDVLNGEYTTYFPNGDVDFVSFIKDDAFVGLAKKHDPKGVLAYQITYLDDNPVAYTYNDAGGKLKEDIKLDRSTGTIKTFFANGKPSRDCAYIGGYKHGRDRIYYENGSVREDENYEFGIQEGDAKEYYENGKIYTDFIYLNDNLHGLCKTFNENGTLKNEINYQYGVIEGPAKYYSESGKLIQTKLYEHGELKSVKNE